MKTYKCKKGGNVPDGGLPCVVCSNLKPAGVFSGPVCEHLEESETGTINILVIEDDNLKAKDVRGVLEESFPGSGIDTAAAYGSGIRKVFKGHYDFVVIDNSLPYYEEKPYDIHPDMAQMILEEILDFSEETRPKCIICSQYDPGEKEAYFFRITTQYPNCLGIVRYDCCSDVWKTQLVRIIKDNIE